LIRHVGSAHNIVEGFLPSEHRLPRSTRGNFLPIPSSGLGSQDDEDSNRKQDQQSKSKVEDKVGASRKYLECHICHSKEKSRNLLYGHYARIHYREEIKALFGENLLECQFCQTNFSTVDNLVVHIGNVHNKVEENLPAKFRIERFKRGLFQTDPKSHKENTPESTSCGEMDTSVDYLTSHPDSLPDRFQSQTVDGSSFEKSDEEIEKEEENPRSMITEGEIKEDNKMSEKSSIRERFWSFIDDSESDSG